MQAIIVYFLLLVSLPIDNRNTNITITNYQEIKMDNCIAGWLDNIAGDTYAIKLKNTCDEDYKVYYMIKDGDTIIQDTSQSVVRKNSENSSGTIHCKSSAKVVIIKKEAI